MNKKMIMISMVIIALISAGAVAAISMNYDPEMKAASFDGIKMQVPHDAKFVKTAAGFEDTKYKISVQTFKDNQSIVNYLNSLQGAKMLALANLPANAIAFQQGDMTYILVTNGQQAICVGALDENLDVKMANSIVFKNGKTTKVHNGFMGVGANHPSPDNDYNLTFALIGQVNIFDLDQYNLLLLQSNELTFLLEDSNGDWNPNNDVDVTGNQSSEDVGSNSFDSLLGGDSSDDEGAVDMGSDGDESGDGEDSSDDPMASGNPDDESSDDEKLSESECKQLVKDIIPTEYKISKTTPQDGGYVFEIENETGDVVGKVSVDEISGELSGMVDGQEI